MCRVTIAGYDCLLTYNFKLEALSSGYVGCGDVLAIYDPVVVAAIASIANGEESALLL